MTSEEEAPEVSVVIASFGEARLLNRCLASVLPGAAHVEVIVASCLPESELRALRERYPDVAFVSAEQDSADGGAALRETRVFRLRSRGVEAARGRVIALLEDHCAVGPDWISSLVAAHDRGPVVAGGPVSIEGDRKIRDWAIFWCEYAALMPPIHANQVSYLSAVNASYLRDALQSCHADWVEGFYDNEVHDAMKRQGCALCLVPEAEVETALTFSFLGAAVHLFTGGRRYGRYQGLGNGRLRRILRIAATPVVPLVLLSRIVRIAARRRPERLVTVALGLPWIVFFLGAWAAGEALGAIEGVG